MTEERDPLLDEISRALAIEPSPEFTARVRARVQHAPGGWPWTLTAVAAMAVAVAVVTSVVQRELPVSSVPQRDVALERQSSSEPVSRVREQPPMAPRSAARRALQTSAAPRGFEVVLPQGQLEGVRRWMAQVQPLRRAVSASSVTRFDDLGELQELPEIAAIEWPSVTIDPLEGSDDGDETNDVRD